jgi:hypothetical protein
VTFKLAGKNPVVVEVEAVTVMPFVDAKKPRQPIELSILPVLSMDW